MRLRRGYLTLLLGVVLGGLAMAERGLHDVRARELPSDGAQWIWAEGPWEKSAMPASFLAACDFTLDRAPGDRADARLSILADEEYLIYVNGRLVGSNRYRAGAPFDVYEVGDLLQGGGNRVVAEVRSSRGGGGLLAMTEVAGEEGSNCPSGPGWRIFRRRSVGVLRGWLPLANGEAPRLWGWSPTGRWGTPTAGSPRPRLDGSPFAPPIPAGQGETLLRPAKESTAKLTLYDWGEEVFGFVRLRFTRGEPNAVVYFGAKRPDPRQRPADLVLVGMPGEVYWRSAVPLRLRYLLIGGSVEVRSAEVLPYGPEFAAAYPPAPPPAGLLGIEPPPLRPPVEDEIRRQLEGFAGLARREEP
jgi:hypothetical protein